MSLDPARPANARNEVRPCESKLASWLSPIPIRPSSCGTKMSRSAAARLAQRQNVVYAEDGVGPVFGSQELQAQLIGGGL